MASKSLRITKIEGEPIYYKEMPTGRKKEMSFTYYVGETEDIKAIYKSISRHKKNNEESFICCDPKYKGEFPKFTKNKKIYAICIENNGHMTVVNSDTILSIILQKMVNNLYCEHYF